jgi:hypothetical protein
MSTYTRGPWAIDGTKIISTVSWFVPPDESFGEPGIHTVVIDGRAAMGGDDTESDKRLIAAAPEMIEAMQWFCERVERGEVRNSKTYARFKEIITKVLVP